MNAAAEVWNKTHRLAHKVLATYNETNSGGRPLGTTGTFILFKLVYSQFSRRQHET
jgi:hypothetical protein